MPYGHYNDTLDNVLSNPATEIDWMARNKVNPNGWDLHACYGVSLSHANLPNVILQCYLKKLKIGIACSRTSEVDAVIAYNARQTDFRKRIAFITSELEAEYANNNCTIAEYRTWIPQWYSKCKAAGIKMYIYEGWNYQYDVTVGNCDGFFLHAYRTSTQMATTDDMFKYMNTAGTPDRLITIANEAKKKGVIVEVSVLTSTEPTYGFDFYKTRPLGTACNMVRDSFNRLASQDVKDYVIIDGEMIFETKYTKQIKP